MLCEGPFTVARLVYYEHFGRFLNNIRGLISGIMVKNAASVRCTPGTAPRKQLNVQKFTDERFSSLASKRHFGG